MSDPYFQAMFADRIGGVNYGKGTAIYKFEKIKRAKRKALADFPERSLLDFGIGDNDEMAPASVRRAMESELNKPENRGYADNGPAEFKEAAARFMNRNFGVVLVESALQSQTKVAARPPLDNCGFAFRSRAWPQNFSRIDLKLLADEPT